MCVLEQNIPVKVVSDAASLPVINTNSGMLLLKVKHFRLAPPIFRVVSTVSGVTYEKFDRAIFRKLFENFFYF